MSRVSHLLPTGRPRLVLLVVALLLVVAVAPAAGQVAPQVVPAPSIVPFEQWAPASCPTPTGGDVAATQRIVVHHSHHPTAARQDDVLPALAELCRIHLARGFDTVGYHYVVDPWGTVYQARGALPDAAGRAPTAQAEGAHVHGGNPGATGVVFLGDHQSAPPTEAAVDAAVHLLAWLVEATGKDPAALVGIETTGEGTSLHNGRVEVEVLAGHSATNATLCPGEHLIALLGPIRDRVRAAVTDRGGILSVPDSVGRAPLDDVATLASSGPILAAPPVEPVSGVPSRMLLLGVALLAGVLALPRRPRSPAVGRRP